MTKKNKISKPSKAQKQKPKKQKVIGKAKQVTKPKPQPKKIKNTKLKTVKKPVKQVVSKAKVKPRAKVKPVAKAKIIPTKKTNKKTDKSSIAIPTFKETTQKHVNTVKPTKAISTIFTKSAKKPDSTKKPNFKIDEFVVYPSHGVGKIVGTEKTTMLGRTMDCYLMSFEKERLEVKIPFDSAEKVGLRRLISKSQMDEVFIVLRSGVKKLKGMWSRRAQEYETKINSGDITLLAEVLRDLTRDIEDCDRSYSERIIYETAIYRLASEYGVIYGVTFNEARDKIVNIAKDKLSSDGRMVQQDDDFDDFDVNEDSDEEEELEEEEDGDGDEDDGDGDGDGDDDKPKKKKKKK